MILEEREVPRNYNIGIREMLEDEDADDDIVEINWEDIEQISEDCSLPGSEEEKDEYEDVQDEEMEINDDAAQVLSGHTSKLCYFFSDDPWVLRGFIIYS